MNKIKERNEDKERKVCIPGLLVISKCIDAFSQAKQRSVDVSSFFQTIPFILGLSTSLRSSQITQRQPETTTRIKKLKKKKTACNEARSGQTDLLAD